MNFHHISWACPSRDIKILRCLRHRKRRRHSDAAGILAAQCLQYSPRYLAGEPIHSTVIRNRKHRCGRIPAKLSILDIIEHHLMRHLHCPKHN
ncbi:hypothetical protein Lal_00006264 [Lupinus albus]|nr:hypothetical protein Lal_00006264 [Lupinus albus]